MRLTATWWVLLLGVFSAHASEFRVTVDQTPVFTKPSADSGSLGALPLGKRVHSLSEEGAFLKIRSRAGRSLWVPKASLLPVTPSDVYEVSLDAQSELPVFESSFKRLRLDLGASGGSFSGQTFIEVAGGLEYFMMERLSWRNALFYRLNRLLSDIYGFDSSARGNGNLSLGALKLRGIIGAGFRFATSGQEAPFLEVGGFARLSAFELGFMLKYLVPINNSTPNVAIYSAVFSGATGFF
jgi:hypothetical protein